MQILSFTCKTLKDCIVEACKKLNISEDKLQYTIIESKKGLFISKVTIEVKVDESGNDLSEENEDNYEVNYEEKNGTARVENGKVIIKAAKEGGRNPQILPPKNLSVFVDGREIKELTVVNENSIIQICNEDEPPKRFLHIQMDNNKMHAFVTINYVPQCVYKFKDAKETNILILEKEILEEKYPPTYKEAEIMEALRERNITYGIIRENLCKCLDENGVEDILVAKGIPFIEDQHDIIDIKFNDEALTEEMLDEMQKVDFKNLHSIKEVKKGDTIAVRHSGKEGKDGINIFGKLVKRPKAKKKLLKVGQGALIKGNTVIAGLEGKPVYKNGTFYVFPVHEVMGDVDIANGNIDFIGEVIIHGSVKEGMEVKAHGKIAIDNNVAGAKVFSKSDINIQKNIISSEIAAGGEDVEILNRIDCLDKMKDSIRELIKAADEIKALTNNVNKDGEIVKLLIENKYKNIPRTFFKMLKYKCSDGEEKNEIIDIIKNKLIGLGPIEIQSVNELYKIVEMIEDKLKELNKNIALPVDVNISYCQDSVIKSSGSIYVNGKGEYVSDILAKYEVIFTNENAVARGGLIKADNKIQCAEVGSEGGVVTKLQVAKKGHIFAKKAYQNTVFIVGSREFVLDTYSRDVHVYLDTHGDISVDRLNG